MDNDRLQRKVEQDVRLALGDLHIQIIMMRAEMEQLREHQPPAQVNGSRPPAGTEEHPSP